MIETVAWIGNVLFVLGALELARKRRAGFVFQGLGNACYVVFAVGVCSPALGLLSGVLGAVNVFGFCNWRSKCGG